MPYLDYQSLAAKEKIGKDYVIEVVTKSPELAFMAIHGGNIEPHTSEIAQALAGDEYSFYTLRGLKKTGNKIMHLSSNSFNEIKAVALAHSTNLVVSIHGMKGKRDEKIVVGGLNTKLINLLVTNLKADGFKTETADLYPHLSGAKPTNICNQCRSGQGVQIEISLGLRTKLISNEKLLQDFKQIVVGSIVKNFFYNIV